MSIKEIIEDITEIEKIIIVILSSNNFQVVKGKTWLQKIIFLLAQIYTDISEEAEFEPYLKGPYSEEVALSLEDYVTLDLIQIKDNHTISLTDRGNELNQVLIKQGNMEKAKLEDIENFKRFLNDLTMDELLAFIYLTYPETKDESTKYGDILNNREKLAISLYKKDKISLERASIIAGVSIVDFLEKL